MQYALVDGVRSGALKGADGACEICAAPAVAKCGERVMHHWAHARDRSCDPWWENETEWHRAWKNEFPEDCRERIRVAPDGEIHRADVITSTGIVVEIQNSPMSDVERRSREAFYKNMIWIVNGAAFRHQFHVLHMLPNPEAEFSKDLVWYRGRHHEAGTSAGVFWRRSRNPNETPRGGGMVFVEGLERIKTEVEQHYCGHHQFDWVRPRAGWLESGCPVYIDFGQDWLWRIEPYADYGLTCVRAVARRKLIHDAMTEHQAADIASRFYPIQ